MRRSGGLLLDDEVAPRSRLPRYVGSRLLCSSLVYARTRRRA